MEIHSSSLSFYPIGLNQAASEKSNHDNFNDHQQNVVKKAEQNSKGLDEVVLTNQQLDKELDQTKLVKLVDDPENSVNLNTQNALISYLDTINQPVIEEREQLTNIDFFI